MRNKKLSFLILPFFATLSLQANDPFGDNIFKEMMEMQKEMDQMFQRMHNNAQQHPSRQLSSSNTLLPTTQKGEFVDEGKQYIFETTIPENKDNVVDLSIENGMMSIRAKIVQRTENNTTHGYSTSSSVRLYQQSTPLPSDANQSTIQMDYVNDKLVISVKKSEGSQTQTIVPLKNEVKKKEIELKENNTTIKKIKLDDSTSMI